jgi:hypothetical protein
VVPARSQRHEPPSAAPCFQQGHRIAAELQCLQRSSDPVGIPELAELQQPFSWCTGRMVAPLELGALADRLLEIDRGAADRVQLNPAT